MKIILASSSIYRQNLLRRAGFEFETHSPLVDEEDLKTQNPLEPEELTRFLALKKAESLLEKFPNDWIVGCDQAAILGKKILNKPGSKEKTIQHLQRLGGRWHRLATSMAIVKNGEIPTVMTDITRLRVRALSQEEITAYVEDEKPFDCAGGYKFEKKGISLIEDLRTKDPTAIEGLSLIGLVSFFIRQGIPLAEVLKFS